MGKYLHSLHLAVPVAAAILIFIFLTAIRINGASRKMQALLTATNGIHNLVYHPIKNIFIFQAGGSVVLAALIFMFLIYFQLAIGACHLILGQQLMQQRMNNVLSS